MPVPSSPERAAEYVWICSAVEEYMYRVNPGHEGLTLRAQVRDAPPTSFGFRVRPEPAGTPRPSSHFSRRTPHPTPTSRLGAASLDLLLGVSSRCHAYIPIYRALLFPTDLSQLTFSDQWFGLQAFTHEVVGSTPGSATFPFAVCDASHTCSRSD